MADNFCPRCGALQNADNVFCPKCGHRLPAEEAAASEAPAAPADDETPASEPTEAPAEAPAAAPDPAAAALRTVSSPQVWERLRMEEEMLARKSRRRGAVGCLVIILAIVGVVVFITKWAAVSP